MCKLTAGLGFEPRYHASEACGLPLADPAMVRPFGKAQGRHAHHFYPERVEGNKNDPI